MLAFIDLKIKSGQIPNIISVPLSCDEELFNDTIILERPI